MKDSLIQRAREAHRQYSEEQRLAEVSRQQAQLERQCHDLKRALKKTLDVDSNPTEPTVTIEGLTFHGWRDARGNDHLFLHGQCPQCGEEAYAEVHALAHLATLLEHFTPGHDHACPRNEAPPPPQSQPLTPQQVFAMFERARQYLVDQDMHTRLLLESIAASLCLLAQRFGEEA